MESIKVRAGDYFPRITLPTISGQEIEVSEAYQNALWHIVVFYRGAHCQRCTEFLNHIEQYKNKLISNGISIIAASADNGQQLQKHLKQLDVSFPIAYGLSIAKMRELNLYISLPQDFSQTDHPFCEPGIFVINNLGQIIIIDIASNEICRPSLSTFVTGVVELKANNEPLKISGNF